MSQIPVPPPKPLVRIWSSVPEGLFFLILFFFFRECGAFRKGIRGASASHEVTVDSF